MNATITGGEVVVNALKSAGTTTLFAIHGGQIDSIFQACAELDLDLVTTRHEAIAGFSAEGYARVSGNLGAALVCPGPGFTNVVTSIANASMDRTPVIYFVGANPHDTLENNALQVGVDHVAIASSLTKWGARVADASHLQRIVAQAIRIASTPPYGPVLVEIPEDILEQAYEIETYEPIANELHRGAPDPETLATTLRALSSAERPAVIIENTPTEPIRALLAEFLSTTGLPLFTAHESLGLLGSDDPQFGGTLYQLGRLPEDLRPDVILALGVQFGFNTPGLRDGGKQWGTHIIHADADPSQIGRLGASTSGILSDPEAMITALAAHASDHEWAINKDWIANVRGVRQATFDELAAMPTSDGQRLHPYAAGFAVAEVAAGENAIMVGDGAVCKHWLHDALQLPEGGRYLTHGALGCMGLAPGLAIGAAQAEPARPVVCVVGDGAVGFALGDFETMVRHELPIVTVVMNNSMWGAAVGHQTRPGGPNRIVGTMLANSDYQDVMVALGGGGARVKSLDELRDTVREAIASGKPYCINVEVNDEGLPPEVPQLFGGG